MKLLFFDDFKLGVLHDGKVVDVSGEVKDVPAAHPQDVMNAVITGWADYRGRLEAAVSAGSGVALESVRVRPPLPRPLNIDCMARNYMEDGTLTERPPINGFPKTPNSIIGHGDTMVLPDIPATIFEGEAELAIVIGKRAQNVPASEAFDYIFGYTNLIDGSARGIPPMQNAFYQMKSRETFCPIGPYLVTADEVPDPQNLPVKLWNNGELKQDFNTSDMAYDIAESVAFVSAMHTLEPGDIIATGTNHRGLHSFQDGDQIDLEVGELGRLTVSIRDDLHRTWSRQTRLEWTEGGNEGRTPPQLTGPYAPSA
ncbi:fumarylacetoacetate hydrolase [Aeromicrobium sp. SMF47]|uniref:fumarylacetoacetate hydrolase family protein n=1 Tax=Aeromicrobium yanjiei TaxID=2662028 RepID=UPI00129E4354|nr:fumarylacetoacetate hydrolase family protein [Aeromicrobium yanjiei]MRJ76124.1 fumarylacetoacetate hydrolase [Aeromicrobium yanjiei]